jgi:hypothetical protein
VLAFCQFATFNEKGLSMKTDSEKVARSTHGGAIYDKTWAGDYWSWNGVIVLASIRLIWWVITGRAGRGFCAAASSFYSAASHAKREETRGVIGSLKFYLAGITSVIFAFACLIARFGQLRWCSASELDVLGTIFSKAGVFVLARRIFPVVQDMYAEGKATDHTMALVFKWRMLDPELDPGVRKNLKYFIQILLEKNPNWPPQIKARLYEALGDRESERKEREKIHQQFG